MKIYSGIDIVENKRIEAVFNKYKDKFLKKIYTEREINYCKNKTTFIECLSARFACKEAVIKAFFSAFEKRLSFLDIEIVGEKNRPATVILHQSINTEKTFNINISISHEKNYSVAIAIIYMQ